MDKSNIKKFARFKSETFRIPWAAERSLGLWVDRIGEAVDRFEPNPRLRELGLFAVVGCLAGEGVFHSERAGGLRVGENDAMIVFPDVACFYHPDNMWRTKWVVWGGPEGVVCRELGFLSPSTPLLAGAAGILEDAHERLRPLMRREDCRAALERKTIILEMILELHKSVGEPASGRAAVKAVDKAVRLIHRNCCEDLRVSELAASAGVSETHFRRLFRERVGRSPKEFQMSLRLSKAGELLAAGKPMKEAAAACGFNDVFYFMRAFKKAAGKPPGAFRDGQR